MKQNLGYRLGKWYRKFRQWQHPTLLKWAYVLIMGTIGVVFWEFVLCVFMIVFIATLPDYTEERYQRAVRERARFMQDVHKQMVKDGYEKAYGYTKKHDRKDKLATRHVNEVKETEKDSGQSFYWWFQNDWRK